MTNFWVIAKHEYLQTVRKRSFLVGILALPLALIAMFALIALVAFFQENNLPIGYVDQVGFLVESRQEQLPKQDERIQIRAYPDSESAMLALKNEQIQAFFVLPPEYFQTLKTELYYLKEPPTTSAWRDFDDFIRINVISGLPAETQTRILAGPQVSVHDLTSGRDFGEGSIVNIIVPFVASFIFYVATGSAAGYMLRVVADEKENRTMEIIITSVTPTQLIGGKVVGLMSVVLTQLVIYIAAGIVGLLIAMPYIPELQAAVVPWGYVGLVVIFFLPAYLLIAAMMVTVGAITPDLQQGQQLAGVLNFLFLLPMFFLALLFENPSHPIVLAMTFFPTTSFLTISLRWGLGVIPLWQLGLSWIILTSSALLITWAAIRIFRMGMLHYGQTFNLKTIGAALRGE